MNVSPVSSTTPSPNQSNATVAQLEKQLQNLQKQVKAITDDKTLDPKSKAKEIQMVQMQIAMIAAQIAQIKAAAQAASNNATRPATSRAKGANAITNGSATPVAANSSSTKGTYDTALDHLA